MSKFSCFGVGRLTGVVKGHKNSDKHQQRSLDDDSYSDSGGGGCSSPPIIRRNVVSKARNSGTNVEILQEIHYQNLHPHHMSQPSSPSLMYHHHHQNNIQTSGGGISRAASTCAVPPSPQPQHNYHPFLPPPSPRHSAKFAGGRPLSSSSGVCKSPVRQRKFSSNSSQGQQSHGFNYSTMEVWATLCHYPFKNLFIRARSSTICARIFLPSCLSNQPKFAPKHCVVRLYVCWVIWWEKSRWNFSSKVQIKIHCSLAV